MKHNDRRDLVSMNDRGFGLFDPFFEDFFGSPSACGRGLKKFDGAMRTDVKETEEGYELEIDMPGFDKKDIGIELSDGYLTISAQKEECSEDKSRHNYVRRERSYGACRRSFYVGDVDEKDIGAKLENGILTVTVPKCDKPDNGSKRIEIR